MITMEINGITVTLTEESALTLKAELDEIRAEKRHQWMLWHWYARRWALYGDTEAGTMFSDMYKDETGRRPRMSREQVLWTLYGREVWIQHKPHCRAREWRLA